MSDTPKTVRVTALKYHTYDGKEYDAGDTYDADPAFLDTLAALQMAKPFDAKPAKKAKPDDDEPPRKHR